MRRVIVLVIAIVPIVVMPASAEAKRRHKPKPKPDLKITRWQTDLAAEGLADRPFAVVRTDGTLQRVEVHLTIRNQGKASAGHSVGEVVIQDSNGRRFPKLFNVPALTVGQRFRKTVTFTGLRPRLGEASIKGIVDVRDQVDESAENNNDAPTNGDPFSSTFHEGEKFPIIAQEWDVTTFSTSTRGQIADIFTTARDNFRFDFSSFDGDTFTYLAYGTVDNHADQTGFCTGTSSEARTHNPWKKSSLEIDYDLASYSATVDSPAETYTISITCPFVGSHSEQHAFGPLDTYTGSNERPVMQPATQKLFGQVTDSRVLTTWTWDFRAKLG